MKNILKVFIIAAGLVICFNAKSFAIVDVAAYGGYIFNGDAGGKNFDGAQYGLKAHYNTSLFSLVAFGVDLGVGGYYQYSKVKFDAWGGNKISRTTAGLDVNVILTLPIVHPYVRGVWAFMDKFDGDNKGFKTYGAGIGVELTIFPLVRLFGEYMYDTVKHKVADISSNAVNVGLKIDF